MIKEQTHNIALYDIDTLIALVEREQLFCIIDGIAHPDVAGFAAERIHQGQASAVPELGSSEYLSCDAVPYLVRLSPRFWRFLTTQVWLCDDHVPRWGFFFEVDDAHMTFDTLVEHFRYWYRVELPAMGDLAFLPTEETAKTNIPAVFRFFDPRLIDAFLQVSNGMERTHFWGPIKYLVFPQACHSTHVLFSPIKDSEERKNTVKTKKDDVFVMRQEHLRALELRRLECRIPEFKTYLEKYFEDRFEYLHIEDRHMFIQQGLSQATKYHFFSERSALGWLSLQLLHGPNFINEKSWALNIMNDKRHTVGNEDRATRLINMGFEQARIREGIHA